MVPLQSKQDALDALGLPADADSAAIKAAFRARAKAAHPDVTPPTPETLSALASAVAAMRILEQENSQAATLEISPDQARCGGVRLVPLVSKRLMVRIPPGTVDGACLTAIGETDRVHIRIVQMAAPDTDSAQATPALPEFVERFAGQSPAARFAGWLRRRPPAA